MADVERPLNPTTPFSNQGLGSRKLASSSLETFRSLPESSDPNMNDKLHSRLEKETRRHRRDQERIRLFRDAQQAMDEEIRRQEELQAQLTAARDASRKQREYANRLEQELVSLELAQSAERLRSDQLAMELTTLKVEINGWTPKIEGVRQEIQRAKEISEECTRERDQARETAREARAEVRQAAEERHIDEARREGLMQGKLEGMIQGWEDGKRLGYQDGRKEGSRQQRAAMLVHEWQTLRGELPEVEDLDEYVPSPEGSYEGDLPNRLRSLEAPIPKVPQPRRRRHRVISASFTEDPLEDGAPRETPAVIPDPLPSIKRLDSITNARPIRPPPPPPQPIFPVNDRATNHYPRKVDMDHERRPDVRRTGTITALLGRKHHENAPASNEYDTAPHAPTMPYPSLSTPLPQARILDPSRALVSPAPSIRRTPSPEEQSRHSKSQVKQDIGGKDSRPRGFGRFASILRRNPPNPGVDDPRTHPISFIEAESTPPQSAVPSRDPSPSPSSNKRPRRVPVPPMTPSASPSLRPQPSPHPSRIHMLPDNYIPELDADGGFSLPPPHEMSGTVEAILSRGPSPSPSQRSMRQSASAAPSRDHSPQRRMAKAMDGLKRVSSKISGLHKSDDERDRSPISRPTSRSRPRSRRGSFIDDAPRPGDVLLPLDARGMLKPEPIRIQQASDSQEFDGDDYPPQRDNYAPTRKSTANSAISGSPISQFSILDTGQGGGALHLKIGDTFRRDGQNPGLVTYPSVANLSIIQEEKRRQSYVSPSPIMRQALETELPPTPYARPDFIPPTASALFDQGNRDGALLPRPPSSLRQGPPVPVKSPRSNGHAFPWSNRPVPAQITMPALLGAQSPTPSSRGGIAGIGAGGGYHRRGASAGGPALGVVEAPWDAAFNRSRASPLPFAADRQSAPPIAPKPQPPASRRNQLHGQTSGQMRGPYAESPYQDRGHSASRSWSGEQVQIGETVPSRSRANSDARGLLTVDERGSIYRQPPDMRHSTGSVNTTHSNRMRFDPATWVDPAFVIPTEITKELERTTLHDTQHVPLSDEPAPSKSVSTFIPKRVSKVLKFGKKK